MDMDTTIRQAEPGDAPGIARVHTLGWQQGFAGLLPADFLSRRVVSAESWVDWLARPLPGSAVFVADAGELVGFALVGPVEGTEAGGELGELKALYVLADRWGDGIGYRLHRAGLQALVELGYRRVQLTALAANTRTLQFYRRQGWVEDGPVTDADIGGLVAPVQRLRHDLTGPAGERGQKSRAR